MTARAGLPVLTTARLRLRPRTLADLDACVRMDREPGTLDFIDWPGKTAGWTDDAAHREHVRARTLMRYPPGLGYWVIARSEAPDEFLGWVELIPEGTRGPEVEIGWRLTRAARGRGYATEAASALLDYGFSALGLKRVVADMHRANRASMRVAERLGMREHDDPERTNERYVLWVVEREAWAARDG